MKPGIITVVGLGPGDPSLRSVAVAEILATSPRVLLRTAIHPGLESLRDDPRISSCDELYEAGRSFDEVYASVVDRVVSLAESGDLVYAVPGSPGQGERTVSLLRQRLSENPERLRVIPSVGALDVLAASLGIDLMADEVQILDALTLSDFVEGEPFRGLPDLSPTRPALITQLYAQHVASSAKIALSRFYPDEHPVVLVSAAGTPEERIVACRLFEIDRRPVEHLTTLYVPALDMLQATRSPRTIHQVAARLRAPGGCPWDREQTHASLRAAVIEEAYEVVDAIDEDDPGHLAEELGDLLIQVALHAQIAEEAGDFTAADVHEAVNAKLVRRHPHVFGDVSANTSDEVRTTWAGVKATERAAKGDHAPRPDDPFDRLPRSMPVLAKLTDINETTQVQADQDRLNRLADEAYGMIVALIAAGCDPEKEIARAYKRARAASGTNALEEAGE